MMALQKQNFTENENQQTSGNRKLKDSEYLNLPDLHFFLSCQNKYKINKGVYNTIDNWFYEHGVVPIIQRRIHILAFLDFVNQKKDSISHKYVRFGNGGLTKTLNEFTEEIETGEFNI
ncbi:hypothetical protein [Bacillus benzoevorans]|uniref:Uncharacterized protein n=2 Tax=Bacillus benzoevorans TaxID=1456 RepID=A0A7X0LTU8_9BACI|nr:hypothetical protein [Bacillus benzoevorans]MBB6444266.1 hypothetical protein [Bacillus benzoevorans]